MTPFSFSIADGIAFGFIAYVLVRTAQGHARRVDPLMWLAAGAFAVYFLVPVLQDNLSWI
jgi:AGZA family xanthine/uracil permease-like MFS transporter